MQAGPGVHRGLLRVEVVWNTDHIFRMLVTPFELTMREKGRYQENGQRWQKAIEKPKKVISLSSPDRLF